MWVGHREVHWSQVHIPNLLHSLLQNNISYETQHFDWLIKEFSTHKKLQNFWRSWYELFIIHFVNVINRSIFQCKGDDFSWVSIKFAAQQRMEIIPHCGSVTSITILQCNVLINSCHNFNNQKHNKISYWCNICLRILIFYWKQKMCHYIPTLEVLRV